MPPLHNWPNPNPFFFGYVHTPCFLIDFATKTHEICDELGNLVVPNNLVDLEANVFDAKLEEFTICMKHQILNVLHLFFFFLHEFDRKKCHNILLLMLDLKFKNMHMVTYYLGHVNVSILVFQYDEHLFLLLLVHYYKVLMPNFLNEVKVHNFDFECEFVFVIMGTNAKKMKKLLHKSLVHFIIIMLILVPHRGIYVYNNDFIVLKNS